MSIKDRIFRNKTNILIMALVIIISILFGYLHGRNYSYLNRVVLYTVDTKDEGIVSYDTSNGRVGIKEINIINKNFEKKYKSKNLSINIRPISANKFTFEMTINSKNSISKDDINDIGKDYVSYVKGNSEYIKFIDIVSDEEFNVSSDKYSDILFSGITSVLYILSFLLLLYHLPNEVLSLINNNKFKIVFLVLSVVSSLMNFQFLLAVIFAILTPCLTKINIFKNEKLFLLKISATAFLVRLIAVFSMVVFNFYRYGSKFSYLQPDEMFYYDTGDKIANLLYSLKIPDLRVITEVKQYAYNLFAGIVTVLNKESFYSLKIINALICVLIIIFLYSSVINIFNNISAAKLSTILAAFMPTMILFSTFAIRDIFIALFIFLLFDEIVNFRISEKSFSRLLRIILYSVSLWYLRNYALMLIVIIGIFYAAFKVCIKFNVKILYVIIIGAVALYLSLKLASKFYTFSLINLFANYFKREGIIRYASGILLSITNLDFLTNTSASLYTSSKSLLLRFLYPETLFLIISLPVFVIGILKAIKKRKDYTYTVLLLFVGFITIYKLQYGGWFLRTQLQIFPFQYIFISLGIIEILGESDILKKNVVFKVVDRVLKIT